MLSVRCEVCDVSVNTQEQLRLHETGKQHLKRMQQRHLKADFLSRAGHGLAASSEASSFRCELCGIRCESAANLQRHNEGFGHRQRLLQGGPTLPPGPLLPTSVRCALCCIECNTYEQLQAHERGSQHLKKLQASGGLAAGSRRSQQVVNGAVQVWCNVCGIFCNTPDQMAAHERGEKHLKKLRSSGVLGQSSEPAFNAAVGAPPRAGHDFMCARCGTGFRAADQLQRHRCEPSSGAERAGPGWSSGQTAFGPPNGASSPRSPAQAFNGGPGLSWNAGQGLVGPGGQTEGRTSIWSPGNVTEGSNSGWPTGRGFVSPVGRLTDSGNSSDGPSPVRPASGSVSEGSSSGGVGGSLFQSSEAPGPGVQAAASLYQASVDAGIVVRTADANDIRCRLCQISCNTKEAMETHLSGGKHQRKTKLLPPGTLGPELTAAGTAEDLTREMLDMNITEDTGPIKCSDGLVECRVCRLKMNANNADSHFSGKQHRQKLVKSLRAPENATSKAAVVRRQAVQMERLNSWTKTKPRAYQVELFETAMREDCVVFLPTGTGKTLVSALVISQMLDSNPGHQVVFLVEKTLLVLQQADYLRDQMQAELQRSDWSTSSPCKRKARIASVSGDLTDIGDGNLYLWQQDVIVTTVDFYLNLLRKEAVRWDDLCLVVFDEAHHCVKEHPFNRLLRDFSLPRPPSLRPKILGLTASPAGCPKEQETYRNVCKLLQNMGGLKMAAVERCRQELASFSSSCEISVCPDVADPTELDLQCHLMDTAAAIFQAVLPKEYSRYVDGVKQELRSSSPNWDLVSTMTTRLLEYAKQANLRFAALAGLCLSAFHNLQAGGWALACDDVTALQQRLCQDSPGLAMIQTCLERLKTTANAAAVTHASGVNISCVMSKLVDLVLIGLRATPQVAAGSAVVLVLTSQRSVARSVADYLDIHIKDKADDVKVTSIVGHGSTSGQTVRESLGDRSGLAKGMSVGQQQNLLRRIKDFEFKVIVATSVAEEGVDLPSCGLVILLAPPTNMTALVQMRGRARLRESRFVILCREPEQKQKLEGLIERESNMQNAVRRVVCEQKTTQW